MASCGNFYSEVNTSNVLFRHVKGATRLMWILWRACTLLLLLISSSSFAFEPNNPRWEVTITPFNQVFPALELSQTKRTAVGSPTSHIRGDGTGLIAVRVFTEHAVERLRLTVNSPFLTHPSEIETAANDGQTEYELHPRLAWNLSALSALNTAHNETLSLKLEADGISLGERQIEISLRPLSEALYYVRDGGDAVDLSFIFAAYVNERDAIVTHIIEQALDYDIVETFDGYASHDANQVYRQVWAVWQAIEAQGIRYSDANPAISHGPNVYSQRVRFLNQTWNDRTANCVDGSVLLASVLQRLGLHSFLVLVPGHAFIGFYTDAESHNAAYLETTVLGEPISTPVPGRPSFATSVTESKTNQRSLISFRTALAAGRLRYQRVKQKFDGRHRPDYVLVDIATARTYGISPIAIENSLEQSAPKRTSVINSNLQ